MLNKESFNLRRKTKKIYSGMLIFIIGGMLFFLSSGFIFEEKVNILASPVNEDINIGSTKSMTINEWIYDSNKNEMRIIIDVNDFKKDYNKLTVDAYQRSDGKAVKANIVYESHGNIVVTIKGLSKEYEQVALDVNGTFNKEYDDNEDVEENSQFEKKVETIKTLYTDHRKVKHQDINSMTERELSAYITDMMVQKSKNEIKDKEKEIRNLKESISDIDKSQKEIEQEKIYQTDSEKVDSDNDLNALETKKKDTEDDINSLKNDIEQINNRIQKLLIKQRDMETN